jgi:TPR repeat protein
MHFIQYFVGVIKTMKFIRLTSLALIFGIAPAMADVKAGFAALAKEDYATAVREFKASSDQGDTVAQINLAGLYIDGRGTPTDLNAAVKLAAPLATKGDQLAQMLMGRAYEKGYEPLTDGRPNMPQSVYWYELSARQGFAFAQGQLGNIYNAGNGVPRDFKKSVYWLCLAIKQGDEYAKGQLSRATQTEMRLNRSGFNVDDATCK